MAAINETRRRSPQFRRACNDVTHLWWLCQRMHFSANCFFSEFGNQKKLASFSLEFLVFTMLSLALRAHSSVVTTCRRCAGVF